MNSKEKNGADVRRHLEELYPSATLSVELPFEGNGNLYQVRTTVSNEIFYGRASTEDEAVEKCCKKAIKYICQQQDRNVSANSYSNIKHVASTKSRSIVPRDTRANLNALKSGRECANSRLRMSSSITPCVSNDKAAKIERRCQREKELRFEMGDVLERVESWSQSKISSKSTKYLSGQPKLTSSAHNQKRAFKSDSSSLSSEFEKPTRQTDRGNQKSQSRKEQSHHGTCKMEKYQKVQAERSSKIRQTISYKERSYSLQVETFNNIDMSNDEYISKKISTERKTAKQKGRSIYYSAEEEKGTYCNEEAKNQNLSEHLELGDASFKDIPLKNAVMMLNEMFPPPRAPQYKVTSQTGPPNNPTFTMMCCLSDQVFSGEGKSKKEAKLSCSQSAIEAICGAKVTETKQISEKSNPRASCDLDDWMELEGKNPVSILNELYPGIQYQLISTSGPSHAPQFVIKASLNDMSFEGSGKSKKDAKLNASKALLVHLHKVGFDPMTGDMMSTQEDRNDVATGHSFADQIGQLVTAKYQSLFGSTTYSKRRVMAGVVVTENWGDIENTGKVVCVSSGTKCINGEQLSLEGCVINDSHAEIVTRRCLIIYLYQQLETLIKGEASIFQKEKELPYKIRDGVEFHLFITTSPCGDARIFSLHESSQTNVACTSPIPSTSSVSSCLTSNFFINPVLNAGTNFEAEYTNDRTAENTSEINRSMDLKDSVDHEVIAILGGEKAIFNINKECEEQLSEFRKSIAAQYDKDDDTLLTSLNEGLDSECSNDAFASDASISFLANESTSFDPCSQIDSKEDSLADDNTDNRSGLSLAEDSSQIEVTRERSFRQGDSSRGMLRSKIECGMGTVPISPKPHLQTWDGVMSGDRLLTMACSDKILRWNVLGIQGALLTLLIRPIYVKSITVGSKFHPGHMKRAMYERIANYVDNLPDKYSLNVPELFATTSPETRQATKAHDYSANWVLDYGQPEIVNGSTGKTINDTTSRLSKKSMFEKFLVISKDLMKTPITSPARYSEVKYLAKDYQQAKRKVFEALVTAGCGHWVEKPVEQDQFSL